MVLLGPVISDNAMGSFNEVDRRTVLTLLAGTGAGAGGLKAMAAPRESPSATAVGPGLRTGGCDSLSDPQKPVWIAENSTNFHAPESLNNSGGLNPIRVSYDQQVWYLGSTWNETETQWEHEFAATTRGLSSVWRQDVIDATVCPPVDVDPMDAACIPDDWKSESDPHPQLETLAEQPSPRFSDFQSLEIALDETQSDFGSIQVNYQSNELLFWDHRPFLKDGIAANPQNADPSKVGLGQRYSEPQIITDMWTDGWREPPSRDFTESYIDEREQLLHELSDVEDPPVDPEDVITAAISLGLSMAPPAAGATAVASKIQTVAPIVLDILVDASKPRARDPPPNEAFFEEVTLDFPVPIVGHHIAFKILSPAGRASTSLSITSRVGLETSVSRDLANEFGSALEQTTEVSLATSPEPGPAERVDWIFDDEMFHSNMANLSSGDPLAELSGVTPLVSAPADTVSTDEELVFTGGNVALGDSELTGYAWLWVMEQPGETPQMGRTCRTDVSTIADLVIPPSDFEKPGTLTVWLLARDETGVWGRDSVTVEIEDAGSGSTPTDSPHVVVDDFEDGDLSEYDRLQDNGGTVTVQRSTVVEGSHALMIEAPSGKAEEIMSTAGLNAYPQLGDTLEIHFVPSASESVWFYVWLGGTNRIKLSHDMSTFALAQPGYTRDESDGAGLEVDKAYYYRVDLGTDGTVVAELRDGASDSVIATRTIQGQSPVDGDGIAFTVGEAGPGAPTTRLYVDDVTITNR